MRNAAQNRQQATEEPNSRSSLVVHRQHPYRLALPSARYEHDDELTIMVLEVAGLFRQRDGCRMMISQMWQAVSPREE